jgi:hypothetical protein
LAFAVAAGVGATAALMLQGHFLSLPAREQPQPAGEQGNTPQRQGTAKDRSQQKEAGTEQQEAGSEQKEPAEQQSENSEQESASRPQEERDTTQQEGAASQLSEAEYVDKVGRIQNYAVETFTDSHDKLLRYDALTADDVEQMRANKIALQKLATQVENLDPPEGYENQYEVFVKAISGLHEAVQVAYNVAADPPAATKSEFDEYDRLVREASGRLQQSNQILSRDYKTAEGVQEISPL